MKSQLGSQERPLRVAIIGSGPSGFYTLESLFKSPLHVQVDLYDRLPTPFGLVRYGVAPDHPKIKNVIKVYEKNAIDPRFAFFGHVAIGRDVRLMELQKFYDAVVFASGAETDKPLGIAREDLRGSHTATEFVGWYNGHPDYQNRSFDLSGRHAVIVGLGNVAMDVARILAKTVDELKNTDITQNALEVLTKSQIREIHIIGRRGPIQSAFTPAEIKELGDLADCDPLIDPQELILNEESLKEMNDVNFPIRRKNYEILQKYSLKAHTSKKRKIIFHYLRSPREIKGEQKIEQLVLGKNKLVGDAGSQNSIETGQRETLPCDILFRSVGYRGVSLPDLPFDENKGIIPNDAGRIITGGKVVAGLYVSGWIKRGPSGVIGTNKPDSEETAQSLLDDIEKLKPCDNPRRERVIEYLKKKNIRFVTYSDWKKIDAAEIQRGAALGKPREKFTSAHEMLNVLNS